MKYRVLFIQDEEANVYEDMEFDSLNISELICRNGRFYKVMQIVNYPSHSYKLVICKHIFASEEQFESDVNIISDSLKWLLSHGYQK